MVVLRKSAALLCPCLLLCATKVVLGQFQLEPVNVTSLQGSSAQFNATVQGSWTSMTWTVGGLLVLTMPSSGDPDSFLPRFSARLCGAGTTCVEFTIDNVTRRDAGPVVCFVQGEYGDRTAQLFVQESGSVRVLGGDRTVQQDERVEFQCEADAWFPAATVSWTLNGFGVNGSLVNTTSEASGDGYNSTSAYTFQAVRNTTVTCLATVSALPNPISHSVQLVVVPKPTDWTVLIAIVVSFSSFALLVLLILGIIFCYKRRKEKQPTYQAEMMRQRTQSQLSNRPTPQRQGQANPVFTVDGQTSLPRSERDSGFYQTNGALYEQPENSSQIGNGSSPAYNNLELNFPKHRHVTIV